VGRIAFPSALTSTEPVPRSRLKLATETMASPIGVDTVSGKRSDATQRLHRSVGIEADRTRPDVAGGRPLSVWGGSLLRSLAFGRVLRLR
jgi:hypothetical protein